MKNKFILFLIFSIFILQFVSAVEFNMKSEYAQGESIIAEISGNFLERLSEESIYFYRGHVKIPMLYDFAKIEDKYYLYVSLLGKTPANYSVVIEGAKYMKGAEKIEQDIAKNFSISESTADFSLDKGFLLTEKGFSIEVQNLQDSDLEIKIKDSESIKLYSGQIKELYFGLNNFSGSGMNKIELTSENLKYEIPVYILGEFVNEPETKNEKSFKFEPGELNFSMPTNSKTSRIIYLYNNGNVNLEDISFSISNNLDSYVSYSVEEIKELFSEESRKITLNFNSNEAKIIQGTLKAKTDELEIDLDIYVGFLENYVGEEVQEVKDPSKIKTCEELGGIFCGDDQECSIDKQYAKDGNCCLEICQEPEVDNSGKIIGWVIVIAIVVVLIWFFKSKAKIKNMPDLMKAAKGRK